MEAVQHGDVGHLALVETATSSAAACRLGQLRLRDALHLARPLRRLRLLRLRRARVVLAKPRGRRGDLIAQHRLRQLGALHPRLDPHRVRSPPL